TNGTRLVMDFTQGPTSSDVYRLTAAGGKLFFVVTTPANGQELWLADPATGQALLVKDLHPGVGDSSPYPVVAAGGKVFFTAFDGLARELFTAGPAAGQRSGFAVTKLSENGPPSPFTLSAALFSAEPDGQVRTGDRDAAATAVTLTRLSDQRYEADLTAAVRQALRDGKTRIGLR